MKYCNDCKKDKPETAFYRKSECCKDCNEDYCKNVMDILKEHYKPEYPTPIQEYLDKRKEKLDKGVSPVKLALEARKRLEAQLK